MELLAGVHSVREALRARRRECRRLLLAVRGPVGDELAALAAEAGVPVELASPAELERRAGGAARSQGVALEAGALPTELLEALLNRIRGSHPCLVATDGVLDPQNLGAIARVADAAGADGLVLTERRSPPLSPAVSRASAGAIEHLPVARVPNLARALDVARSAGFWALGADAERGRSLFDPGGRHWEGSVVLVLGSEEKGIRPGLAKHLDHWVRIPMGGHVGSLNVATAAAVLLFDRKRCLGERARPDTRRQDPAQTPPPP